MIELRGYPVALIKSGEQVLGELDEWRFVDTLLRNVDPDLGRKIPKGSSLFVRGWTLLDKPPRAARGVLVMISEQVWFETTYGKARQDIAAAYGENGVGVENSGYAGIGKLPGLSLGSHEFIVAVLDERDGYHELARQHFELVPSSEQLARLTRATEGRLRVSLDEIVTLRDPGAFDGRTLRAKIGDVLYVRGWSVDLETQTGLTGVFGVIDGDEYVVGVHGLPRDDVAAAYSTQRAHKSGFTLRIPTQAMSPGQHKLEVAVVAADRHSYLTHPVADLELSDR